TVACAPPEHVIGYPGKWSRWQVKCTMEIVLNDPTMGGKCAIYHQCLYFSIAGAGHDGNRSAHRITYGAQMILRCTLLCVGNGPEKIIDLTITKCQGCTHYYTMPIILKNEDVVTCFPKMCAYSEEISHTRTKPWTYQNAGCGFWIGNIIATYLVVSVQRCKSNSLSRQTEFIRTDGIAVKRSQFFGSGECFHDKNCSSQK